MEIDHTRSYQTSNAIGFFLLPSELIHYIILQLALPDIVRLKSVNKLISSIISDHDFVRDYNFHSASATWLFIYKKRWRRDALLHGYTNYYSESDRWFKILIADILKPVVPPGEDLYLLAASGNFFLFALNNSREVISVNPMNRTVKRIPPSPLGPRGTSSWRRSGMKLLSYPRDHFRFLFAEMEGNGPVLFEYDSRSEKWQSTEAVENGQTNGEETENSTAIFLSAFNDRSGSIVISKDPHCDRPPLILRPIFTGDEEGNPIDRLHVYGDGKVMIIKSKGVEEEGGERRVRRMLKSVDLWGLSKNGGRNWELMSRVPNSLFEKIKKPYGAMMGCLEEKNGIVKAILMSNLEGSWDIIWLCYHIQTKTWTWLPIPDCKMKGANMAGIAFSSGLSL